MILARNLPKFTLAFQQLSNYSQAYLTQKTNLQDFKTFETNNFLPKMWEVHILKLPKRHENCRNVTSALIGGGVKIKILFYWKLTVLQTTEANQVETWKYLGQRVQMIYDNFITNKSNTYTYMRKFVLTKTVFLVVRQVTLPKYPFC